MAAKKNKESYPKGFAPNVIWMDMKPGSSKSKKTSSRKTK